VCIHQQQQWLCALCVGWDAAASMQLYSLAAGVQATWADVGTKREAACVLLPRCMQCCQTDTASRTGSSASHGG
jgi:hypothetical protein